MFFLSFFFGPVNIILSIYFKKKTILTRRRLILQDDGQDGHDDLFLMILLRLRLMQQDDGQDGHDEAPYSTFSFVRFFSASGEAILGALTYFS